mmetsp:Transcript_8607/g.17476  ORF Transcript_8607/g.17476 Transcript_8607/m.17476 type:complete len:308 (+) Transcript_8607:676-1599(+)
MGEEDGIDVVLVRRVNVPDEDGLGWRHDHGTFVFLGDDAEGGLQLEVTLVLNSTVVYVNTNKHSPVSLVPPSHPVGVLPGFHLPPWLDVLAKVRLNKLAEVIDSEGVDEVLHPSVCSHIPIAVVALGGEDALHDFHDVVFGHKTEVVGSAGERVLLVVSAPHSSANHDVEAKDLRWVGRVHYDDDANVVCVNVEAVISRNSDADLELTGKVAISVEGLDGVREDDAASCVVFHDLINLELLANLCSPRLNRSSLLPIQPNLRKRSSHGPEQVPKNLRILPRRLIVWTSERGRGGHDVSGNVTARAHG